MNKERMKVDPDFDKEFVYEYVGSHANKDLVFCHKPDKTLIEADMMFNLPAHASYVLLVQRHGRRGFYGMLRVVEIEKVSMRVQGRSMAGISRRLYHAMET